MKKLFPVLLFAFLISACTVFAQSGEGSFIYLDMEHAAETDDGYTHTLIADPMKVYENGFYYSGGFIEFDTPAETAADAVDGVLSYYMNSGEPMSSASYAVLSGYMRDDSFFSGFELSDIDCAYYDTPTTVVGRASALSGLGSYNIQDCRGEVFRLVFGEDYTVFFMEMSPETLPASDELIAAMGDYLEAAAEAGVSDDATNAYYDSAAGFFEPALQEDLCSALRESLTPADGKITVSVGQNRLTAANGRIGGSFDALITNGTADMVNAAVALAIYDADQRLVYIKSASETLSAGANTVSFSSISAQCTENYTVKVFVWNSLDRLFPLADSPYTEKQEVKR